MWAHALGGVFREAATLARDFGGHRVFNTPIQEAFIIGSTVGMSAAGLKPIVEVQFADYIWPGSTSSSPKWRALLPHQRANGR
jgi:pyruvate/2-oxoglutarate/acetoin dehydrogenase E1 component